MKPDISTLSKQEKLDLIEELLESLKPSERISYTEKDALSLAKKEWEQYERGGISYPLAEVLGSLKNQGGRAEG